MSFIHTIKRHIKARTEKGLELKMLQNNLRKGYFFQYDITWNGKEWVAWYLDERNNPLESVKELNDAAQSNTR